MSRAADDLDLALERSLRKTMLSENELRRFFLGESLVHDMDVHSDIIGDIINQICLDFEINHDEFKWEDYYFNSGGFVDTILNWKCINFSRKYLKNRFKLLDIYFFRSAIIKRKMPPK